MTEWTAARLDALPDATIIECDLSPYPSEHEWFVMVDGDWEILRGMDVWSSREILAELASGSISVVSVPVDALLSDGAVLAGTRPLSKSSTNAARIAARRVIRAAIGHVTGETP